MKAMILAAGKGERMRPLTDNTPKPLLKVRGKALIDYHLDALSQAGINEVVINIAYLGDKIREHLECSQFPNLKILISEEPEPLETAGAIVHATHLLGDRPFILINGDIFTDFPLKSLASHPLTGKGHLVLVPNPDFHPRGDFAVTLEGQVSQNLTLNSFTFAGISLLDPRIITEYPQKRRKFPLGEALRQQIDEGTISGEVYLGNWSDVGTPERLAALEIDRTQSHL